MVGRITAAKDQDIFGSEAAQLQTAATCQADILDRNVHGQAWAWLSLNWPLTLTLYAGF